MEKQLPKNWVECKLGELATVQSGGTPSRGINSYWNGDIPWVKISDIKEMYVDKTTEFITEVGLKNSSTRIFPKGTILFTIFATLGKIGILNIDAATNQAIAGITPSKFIDDKYLTYSLINLSNSISEYGKGVAQKNINQAILKDTLIPLPPLAEQNRIVEKLDMFFTLLETIKTSMTNIPLLLKDFRKQVLMQAVTGKLLNVNQFTELGNLKIEIKTGPFGSALHKSDYIENGIPVINPSHIHNGSIIPDNNVTISKEYFKKLKAYKLFDNDVILGRRGEMGRAALYNEEYGDCLCGTGSIILRCGNNLYPKFLTYYLRSPFCIEYLNTNSVGSTMVNLNQKIIKSLRVPSISYSEQKEIVNRIESLFAKADVIEQQYKSLKQKIDTLPQALLHKAFKGELTEQLESDGDAKELLQQIQELKTSTKIAKNIKLEKLKSFNKKIKNYPKSEDVLGMVAEGK